MKQVNLKSERVATLLGQITEKTGESKVDAVTKALEGRLQELEAGDRAARTLEWLDTAVWSNLSDKERGHAPSKEEQEALLGF